MFSFFTNQTLAKARRIIAWSEGGIHKRIDENRELLELLQKQAPEVLHKNPWIEGWCRSQDNFLNDLASVVNVEDPMFKPQKGFPRSWPDARDTERQSAKPVDLRAYAEAAHLHANTAMWERVLDTFQCVAADFGYGFTRAPEDATPIDVATMRAIGQAVIKSRLKFIAPLADVDWSAERGTREEEDLAWVDSIVKALSSQGMYVKRERGWDGGRTPAENEPALVAEMLSALKDAYQDHAEAILANTNVSIFGKLP